MRSSHSLTVFQAAGLLLFRGRFFFFELSNLLSTWFGASCLEEDG
ncbi:MAG: hypothetical protein AAFY72_09925 [Cyanobacteria bacterium J06649_4]